MRATASNGENQFKDFIEACDHSRRGNSNFSIKDEFNKLSEEQQSSLLQAINATPYLTDTDPNPNSLEGIATSLKIALENQSTLEPDITAGFNGDLSGLAEGSSIQMQDVYSGDMVTISKSNDALKVNGNLAESVSESGYTTVTYKDPQLKNKFLNELDKVYYQKCAQEGLLTAAEMVNRGMIRELAKHPNSNEVVREGTKLASVFEGQSSFLQLAAKNMSMQQLLSYLNSMPETFVKPYLELENGKGEKVLDLVREAPDKVQLIREFMENAGAQIITLDGKQNVHLPSVHKSTDQSFVRLAQNFLNELHDNATPISIPHERLTSFVSNNLNGLQKRLSVLFSYNDEQLLDYIKPSLDEAQKTLPVNDPEIKKSFRLSSF